MSANVESMMYVGRVAPWHGLGVSVESAPTSEDALVAAGLDWQVGQKEIFLPNNTLVEGYKANVRETDGQVLGIVTDRYTIVQNKEAFAFVDDLLGEGVQYETAGSLQNGKKVWMLAKLPDKYKILDDAVEPFLVFTNSHDGKGSIFAAMTPIRVVCQNTLNLALDKANRTWKTHHVGKMASKMDEAALTLQLGEQYMTALSNEAWNLAKVKLSDTEIEEYIKLLIPIKDESSITQGVINKRKLRQALWSRYRYAPDLQHIGKNAFRFINAVSDFATHQEPLRRTDTYKENLFSKTIDGNALIDKAYQIVKKSA